MKANIAESVGRWWLSTEPNDLWWGTLSFSPTEGATLKLYGPPPRIPVGSSLPIINGVLADGTPITLCRCLLLGTTQRAFGSQNQDESRVYSHLLVRGALFSSYEEVLLDNLRVVYTDAGSWASISGIRVNFPQGGGIDATIRIPDPITVDIDNLLSIAITHEVQAGPWGGLVLGFTAEQTVWVDFHTRELQHFEYFSERMLVMQGLLSLGMGGPTYPERVQSTVPVELTPPQREFLGPDRDALTNTIDFYFQPVGDATKADTLDRFRMLFTLADIYEVWPQFLRTWFQNYTSIKRSYQLYIAMCYSLHTYIEERFLGYARAAEGFHRQTMNNWSMDEVEFDRRYKIAVDSIPSEEKPTKKWVKGRLKHAYEPSLGQRLMELLTSIDPVVALESGKRQAWADKLANARNDLTHPENRSGRPLPTGAEIGAYADQLRFVVECCLLAKAGLPIEAVRSLVERQHRLRGATWPW